LGYWLLKQLLTTVVIEHLLSARDPTTIFETPQKMSDPWVSSLEWPSLDYTYDPVATRILEGNPHFRAPKISENQVLRPKQSKEFVREELLKCHKILENYIPGYQFLDIEFE
jgi:hypothetical protein